MKTILVTGAGGQLGKCFEKASKKYPQFRFLFCDSRDLDITSRESLEAFFDKHEVEFCINCAAYTNVEGAEGEAEKAFFVNSEAAANVAQMCKDSGAVLFHFSTDYVFNGKADTPYKETDEVDPLNIYGASKLAGEKEIQERLESHYIFRTSWLYSEFGHNFYKTILRKADENADLKITSAQLGTPTNANDLAKFVLKIINSEIEEFGLYHYSNLGEATWYDFAKEILQYSGKIDQVSLTETGFYKTKAERPSYSVLSKEKAITKFGFKIKEWKDSLHGLIDEN